MTKAGEQVKAPSDLLGEIQHEWEEQRNRERRASLSVAAAVVKTGGVTERDVFLFAMHGIMPDRPLGEEQTQKVAFYEGLEKRFATGPLAWKSPGYDNLPFISGLALPQYDEDGRLVLRYAIEEKFRGYRGAVELPVTDYHIWRSIGGAEKPAIEPAETARLACVDVDKYGEANDSDFTGKYLTGYAEIYAHRQLGVHGDREGDQAYLGRIAAFVQHTKSVGV